MGVTASKLGKISTGLNGVKRLAGPALTQTPKGYIPVSVGVNNETKTPKGYIPVSVGVNNETKRFMVRVTALRDADFMELLCRSAEEYGFNNEGILRIPYEAEAFEEMMRIKGSKQNVLRVRPT